MNNSVTKANTVGRNAVGGVLERHSELFQIVAIP